jgi:transcription elongation factor GreA
MATNNEIHLTPDGEAKLKAELEELKGPRRVDLAARLRVAIQQGDLKENADYIATKEEQGFVEGRILEVEYMLRHAVTIERKKGRSTAVDLGTKITIQEGDFDPETYYLVGPSEADPRQGRISNESPIGRALMGHAVGEEVTAKVPGGEIQLKILKIY